MVSALPRRSPGGDGMDGLGWAAPAHSAAPKGPAGRREGRQQKRLIWPPCSTRLKLGCGLVSVKMVKKTPQNHRHQIPARSTPPKQAPALGAEV